MLVTLSVTSGGVSLKKFFRWKIGAHAERSLVLNDMFGWFVTGVLDAAFLPAGSGLEIGGLSAAPRQLTTSAVPPALTLLVACTSNSSVGCWVPEALKLFERLLPKSAIREEELK
jgi:hypothetical protein